METHHLEPEDLSPDTKHLESVSTPPDETPEQRADIERALHGIFTERFGTHVADCVMPSTDKLARSHKSAASPNPAPPRKKRRRRPRPKRSAARSLQQAKILSHEARCMICRHPERAAIEEEFLHWANTWVTAREFGVNRRAIYRHAHAFSLFAVRNHNLRYSLGFLVEEADRVTPTADAVVRAIHAFARVNDDGQWVEPPSRVIVSRGSSPDAPHAAASAFDLITPPVLPAATPQNPAADLSAPLDTACRTKCLATH